MLWLPIKDKFGPGQTWHAKRTLLHQSPPCKSVLKEAFIWDERVLVAGWFDFFLKAEFVLLLLNISGRYIMNNSM